MEVNFLDHLNEAQRKAVEYCDGAQLVIAGAGSGKTRVLTYKIAYLLKKGLMPYNILALTFTNKAAREMKERIGKLVGAESARYLQMGTFHSVFAKILRAEADKIGYNANFTIYDQSDSRSLVKTIVKDMQLDDKVYKASTVADRISMAKNHLLLPQAYAASASTIIADTERKLPMIKDIYMRYWQRCRQANAMDFDDLLVNTYLLFKGNEETRRKYVERFQYVLVDEYQDTNHAQQVVVYQLTKERQRITVVGDDAQSIYSFRGANIDNILNFSQSYNNARLFKLEQNYRSTQNIVRAANSLIHHNERQIPKDVFSENEQGEKLILKQTYSDKEEAAVVCGDIRRIKKQDKCEYDDFAILYRTNSQSRSFEECMRKENIPYRIYGGLSFYQRKEIKDVIAYLRVVANPDDEEALRRIINYPTRGIGNTTIAKIVTTAYSQGVSMWSVVSKPSAYHLDVSSGVISKLKAFSTMVEGWQSRQDSDNVYVLGKDIIHESGLRNDIYSGIEPEDISRQENLEELLAAMQDFAEERQEAGEGDHISVSDYLQEVSLLTDLDSEGDDEEPKVTLMTIHSAKGLEFPTVFIVGMEENIFPSPQCISMREIEEERRLLYVAITRAERHCILTCAQCRFRYGKMEFGSPSRFLKDIDPDFIQTASSTSRFSQTTSASPTQRWQETRQPSRPQSSQATIPEVRLSHLTPLSKHTEPRYHSGSSQSAISLSRPTTDSAHASANAFSNLSVGCTIEHSRFGRGIVVAVEGSGENAKATIEFVNVGRKQLLLKFAKYNIIG